MSLEEAKRELQAASDALQMYELERAEHPIVPPYVALRARVGVIFAHYLQDAERAGNSPLQAVLEALRAEVLAALDPQPSGGGLDADNPNRG